MKLENVTAEIRPRGKWESVDLGVALVQKNYKYVMLAWFLTVVPVMAMVAGFAHVWYSTEALWPEYSTGFLGWFFYVYLPFLLIWWWKPIFERVPLYVLSRSLFGEKVSISQLVKQWPKMIFKDAFKLLILRRVSFNRSFVMPVLELEGLKGNQYSQRVNLLTRSGGDGATSLTVSAMLLSWVLMFTGYVTFRWLTMYGVSMESLYGHVESFWAAIFFDRFDGNSYAPLMFVFYSYLFVVTALTPFYSGAGFAIYINSRTISEGWDIELAFKRMSERLRALREGIDHKLFTILLTLSLSFSLLSVTAEAQTHRDSEVKQEITEVLKGEDFELSVKETPIYKEQDTSGSDATTNDFGNDSSDSRETSSSDLTSSAVGFGSVLLWIVCIAIVVLLIILIVKNLHIFRGGRTSKNISSPKKAPVKTVLGMDVTPESLPDDILAVARRAWADGDYKLALSILYRGSLEWMVNTARLPIAESDTERDCVDHCEKVKNHSVKSYFNRLTGVWTAFAYGKIEPENNAIDWLTNDWPFDLGSLPENKEKGEEHELV